MPIIHEAYLEIVPMNYYNGHGRLGSMIGNGITDLLATLHVGRPDSLEDPIQMSILLDLLDFI